MCLHIGVEHVCHIVRVGVCGNNTIVRGYGCARVDFGDLPSFASVVGQVLLFDLTGNCYHADFDKQSFPQFSWFYPECFTSLGR